VGPVQFSNQWAAGKGRSRRLAAQLYLLLSLRIYGETSWPLLVTHKIVAWNVDTLEITFVLLRFLYPAYQCYIPCAFSRKAIISTPITWIHIYISVFFTWIFKYWDFLLHVNINVLFLHTTIKGRIITTFIFPLLSLVGITAPRKHWIALFPVNMLYEKLIKSAQY
jgi:hypothetical protein